MRKLLDGIMYILLVVLIVQLAVLVYKNYTMRDVPEKDNAAVVSYIPCDEIELSYRDGTIVS